ncbi:MAG: hypothetical protein Q4B03_06380 [Lachnospiraceae bacterium]|nr:hypothetical protein [Lachnospiraceae bacterium]
MKKNKREEFKKNMAYFLDDSRMPSPERSAEIEKLCPASKEEYDKAYEMAKQILTIY